MGEKAAAAAVGDQDGAQYCSEHPYRPGGAAVAVAAAAAGGGGICAFCLQEKLGLLVSSSKSSPFLPPSCNLLPSSSSPSSPPSVRTADPALPLNSRKSMSSNKKKAASPAASEAVPASVAGGLKRSKSVAPRPEEQPPPSASSLITSDNPRKKSFWSFLYLTSSSSSLSGHQSTSSTSLPNGGGSARRKSVSVASAAWATRGGSSSSGTRLEAIGEPESPSRSLESSAAALGRKVGRSRSVGCGSRSFSGDFLERLSNGFGDCTLRRVESHREPKPKAGAPGHLSCAHEGDDDGGDDRDYEYEQQHRIKCAGFFGGLGATSSSSSWLSAAEGASSGGARAPGARSHRSWGWALASPMRALRPMSSSSTKTIMAAPHNHALGCSNNNKGNLPMSTLTTSSPMPSSSAATAAATN